MKKVIGTLLAAMLSGALVACGGATEAQQKPSESEVQTEEVTEAAEEEIEEEEGTTEKEETAEAVQEEVQEETVTEQGHYSDPEAFAGFGQYTSGSRTVVFGSTVFSDVFGDAPIAETVQYLDGRPDQASSPETLDPGAFGMIITGWYSKSGANQTYELFNPGDTPVPYEDCVIIGVSGEEGMVFANGIDYYTVTPDEIIAILGDPYEMTGSYYWRDESGDHKLRLFYIKNGEKLETNSLYYLDRASVK